MPLTSDLREVVCSQGGPWISTHDASTERVWSHAAGKVAMQRSEVQGRSSFINPDRRACPGRRKGQEPSGSFACKTRLRKHQPRNHKGEDEAVFPEEKAKISTQSWGKSFIFFFPMMKKESYFPLIWIIFSIHASALMPKTSGHASLPLPEIFQ